MNSRYSRTTLFALAMCLSACAKEDSEPQVLTPEQFVEAYTQVVLAATDTCSKKDSAARSQIALDSFGATTREALDSSISSLRTTPGAWQEIFSDVIDQLERAKSRRDSVGLKK